MTKIEILNILAIVLSPIIALVISHVINIKNERKKEKINILKTLMTQRTRPNSIEYVDALNIIDVVFSDSKKVRNAYRLLYDSYHQKDFSFTKTQSNLMKLIETIVEDVGYKQKISWENIQQPYYPIWLDNKIQADSTIQEYNFAIASSALYGYQEQMKQ